MGLITPNSPDCYINVDGETYYWRDGEAVVFDETFIHYAENKTDQNRIILFADVERPMRAGPRPSTAVVRGGRAQPGRTRPAASTASSAPCMRCAGSARP